MHHSLKFQSVINQGARYCIGMLYNEGHDLAGSGQNAKITSGKTTPILPQHKIHFANWVLLMKAHIVVDVRVV